MPQVTSDRLAMLEGIVPKRRHRVAGTVGEGRGGVVPCALEDPAQQAFGLAGFLPFQVAATCEAALAMSAAA